MPLLKQKSFSPQFLPKRNMGFTLIEIMAVLVIISVIIAIGTPAYKLILPTLNLSGTTRDVVSDLRYAQQKAVSEQINFSILFDLNQNSYQIIDENSSTTIKEKSLNSNINITSINNLTENKATFNALGAVIESGSIILSNNKSASSTIEIKPSGYVKIVN